MWEEGLHSDCSPILDRPEAALRDLRAKEGREKKNHFPEVCSGLNPRGREKTCLCNEHQNVD